MTVSRESLPGQFKKDLVFRDSKLLIFIRFRQEDELLIDKIPSFHLIFFLFGNRFWRKCKNLTVMSFFL